MDKLLLRRVHDFVTRQEDGEAKLFPDLDDEISLSGAAGAWAEGSYVEIDSGTPTEDIYLEYIEVVSITGLHQITLATGAASSEVDILTVPATTTGPIQISKRVPAGTRLSGKTATKAGGSQACAIKIRYKENP